MYKSALGEEIKKELEALCPGQILYDEPMSSHTTFRVGGPAEAYMAPDIPTAEKIISLCRSKDIPLTVLGNGSNVLVSDDGIPGVTLVFGEKAGKVIKDRLSGVIIAEAGAMLSAIARTAEQESLTGLEFAAGIPGTVGGAVLMNAGAYGGEIKDVLMNATCFSADGEEVVHTADELKLSYRHSILMDTGEIVLKAMFKLIPWDKEEIREKMASNLAARKEKQPLEYPSAGSTFKRPEGYFAGKLIQDAGLSGFSVGDAAVSEKHAGFIINKGSATASDIKALIDAVQEKVKENSGVTLVPEVRFIGRF
ncbi:MAG: UDP-N-acetylmuramate dehydrogenase [Lachnospiraceae bacterium]|nr:UDP-N-acetylmuramate dehydrogenase [Lachnospiraceae bacterium]